MTADLSDDEYELPEDFSALLARRHQDSEDLREIVVGTTDRNVSSAALGYLERHHEDRRVLHDLIEIALEGVGGEERIDFGDSPWAAANVIADFPTHRLNEFEAELETISKDELAYLSDPAKRALRKIRGDAKP